MPLKGNDSCRRADDGLFALPVEFVEGDSLTHPSDASRISIPEENVRLGQSFPIFPSQIIQQAKRKETLIATQINPMADLVQMPEKRVIEPREENFARRTPGPAVGHGQTQAGCGIEVQVRIRQQIAD